MINGTNVRYQKKLKKKKEKVKDNVVNKSTFKYSQNTSMLKNMSRSNPTKTHKTALKNTVVGRTGVKNGRITNLNRTPKAKFRGFRKRPVSPQCFGKCFFERVHYRMPCITCNKCLKTCVKSNNGVAQKGKGGGGGQPCWTKCQPQCPSKIHYMRCRASCVRTCRRKYI